MWPTTPPRLRWWRLPWRGIYLTYSRDSTCQPRFPPAAFRRSVDLFSPPSPKQTTSNNPHRHVNPFSVGGEAPTPPPNKVRSAACWRHLALECSLAGWPPCLVHNRDITIDPTQRRDARAVSSAKAAVHLQHLQNIQTTGGVAFVGNGTWVFTTQHHRLQPVVPPWQSKIGVRQSPS